MKAKLDKITDIKPCREHGNIEDLKESIKECGLINPITINQNYKLLAGRRRYQAVKELGWDEVEVRILNSNNELFDFRVAIEENLKRKSLTDIEVATAIKEYDEMKRQIYGEKIAGNPNLLQCDKLENQGWTQNLTAKDLGISQPAVVKAIQIAKAVEEHPELAKYKGGNILLQHKVRKEKEKIKTIQLPEGLYQVIAIDPPWKTDTYDIDYHRGGAKYPVMTIEEIKNIKLPADENCILWLWTINRYLHEAFHILEHWGFEWKNTFTWVKRQLGMGVWGRTQTEHCLLGVKGKPVVNFATQRNIIIADRKGHSEKPDEFYLMVERCCFGKKLDYFATKKREGWATYGTL